MSDLDVADFKMTRLSDVIGKGACDGILGSSCSEIDEIKLAELEKLIKQMKQNWGVDTKAEITQKYSNSLEEKGEPLEDSNVKSNKANMNRKFTIVIKYTRDELRLLATSAICRMPPPCWEEVAKQLPTVLIKHVESSVPQKNPPDGEILKAEKKSSFINYLMFPKQKKNPPLQSNPKLHNVSKSSTKNEENGSSLKCSLSLLCSICKELCKRGVAMPCCDAKACRYCAVKNLTDYVSNVNRECWSCSEGPVVTMDLVVDDVLRGAIREFINTEAQGNRNCQSATLSNVPLMEK